MGKPLEASSSVKALLGYSGEEVSWHSWCPLQWTLWRNSRPLMALSLPSLFRFVLLKMRCWAVNEACQTQWDWFRVLETVLLKMSPKGFMSSSSHRILVSLKPANFIYTKIKQYWEIRYHDSFLTLNETLHSHVKFHLVSFGSSLQSIKAFLEDELFYLTY